MPRADRRRGDIASSIRADHFGRPVLATNPSGSVVWEATWLPFGDVHTETSSPPVLPQMRFPGQWFQLESGLHQNWMRDYDPTTGRYIEPDPLGMVDGHPCLRRPFRP
jgi:RHS repeat-associated protein